MTIDPIANTHLSIDGARRILRKQDYYEYPELTTPEEITGTILASGKLGPYVDAVPCSACQFKD